MLHRTVEYDVKEVQPGLWRWNIYPGNRTVQGPVKFRSRELAVEACQGEINDGIDATIRFPPSLRRARCQHFRKNRGKARHREANRS
jgi:hypothetical protein